MTPWLYDLRLLLSVDGSIGWDAGLHSPHCSAVVTTSIFVQTVVDQPLVVDQTALLEPVPSFQRLVEVILGSISGSRSQVCGRVDVKLVGDRVDVSVRFVPPQTATGRRVIRLVHVVENDLRGVEILVVAGYVVCCDPVEAIDVRGCSFGVLLSRS